MYKETLAEAATVEEALELAAKDLGFLAADVQYEVLATPEKRIFAKDVPARIRAWVDIEPRPIPDEELVLDERFCEMEKQPFETEHPELTEDELDMVADTAIAILRDILKYFDAQDASIDEYEGDDGELLLDIVGADLAVLIGRHGKTLDSLQLLVSAAVNKKLGFRYPVVIDVEGYKYRRKQKIENLARSAAARAIRSKQPVKLHPMTPYERRLVHMALRSDKRVSTASEGVEPNRQVVIKPVK